MKKIAYVLTCLLLCSCSVQKPSLSPYVAVYKGPRVGEFAPEYLILRRNPEIFEDYSPVTQDCVIGRWEMKKDTLLFIPEYLMGVRNEKIVLSEAEKKPSFYTFPRKYLKKKDCLVDVTDYDEIARKLSIYEYWPDAPVPPGETYKRVEQVFRSKSLDW